MTILRALSDWSYYIFGGWPNVFQGLLSAGITGAVAALVSFYVVKRTDTSQKGLASELEARNRTIEAIEVGIRTFIGIPDSRPWRQDFEDAVILIFRLELAASLLAKHDVDMAQKIQDTADKLKEVSNSWRIDTGLQREADATKRYNQAWGTISPLLERMVNWVGNVNPVARNTE